jgi:hypothetical protein
LFNNNNFISCEEGINHWIPFTEKQVKAKEKFASNFMSEFLKDKVFSEEAQTTLNAGLELWKYYHSKIQNNRAASVNASFYDIRAFFQGRDSKGKMNNTSDDTQYITLMEKLNNAMDVLAARITPKVYEYGFLLK